MSRFAVFFLLGSSSFLGCGGSSVVDASADGGVVACFPAETNCSGVCADLSNDSANCGACAAACPNDALGNPDVCRAGVCVGATPPTTCPSQRADCDGNAANGCEADLTTPQTCGSCSLSCDSSQICEVDATTPGACIVPSAPRLIAPLSLSTSSTRRPLFRWTTSQAVASFSLDLCHDRACTDPIATVPVATDSYRPTTDLPTGVVFWRVRAIDEKGAASATWETKIGARSAAIETHFGEMSDFDGDGISDGIVVGGSTSDSAAPYAFLVRESVGHISNALAVPQAVDGSFGANAGDLDGDGYADLFVGSPSFDADGYVISGRDIGAVGRAPRVLANPNSGSRFGYAASAAGDVDGDGYADLVVAESDSLKTRLYVYAGSATGASTAPTALYPPVGAGNVAFDYLAGVGDLNGDGFADVVGVFGGGAGVYMGSSTGLVASPTFVNGGYSFGTSLAAVGDINGDGYSDFAVGAVDATTIFLFLGSATGIDPDASHAQTFEGKTVFGGGDIDGDGFSDLVFGVDGQSNDNIVRGSQATLSPDTTTFLYSNFLRVGDLDGDGRADMLGLVAVGGGATELELLIGAPYSSTTAPTTYTLGKISGQGLIAE